MNNGCEVIEEKIKSLFIDQKVSQPFFSVCAFCESLKTKLKQFTFKQVENGAIETGVMAWIHG